MRIQFRRHTAAEGPGPDHGTAWQPSNNDLYSLLVGKTIRGVAGVRPGAESIMILFDESCPVSSITFSGVGAIPRMHIGQR